MNHSLVTCIIPTRNRQDLLRKALESVLTQTYSNLDIVVVDDASDDDTEGVVEDYARRDSRIRYFKSPHRKGGSASRNIGIERAEGDFVAFLDDDDQWLPRKTECQVVALKQLDGVLCASFADNAKKTIRYYKSVVDPQDLRKGKMLGGTSVLMVKSEVIKKTPFDITLSDAQDWDLFIRLARENTIGFIDQPLVIYNDGGHRRITNELINMPVHLLEERLRAIRKHEAFLGPYWSKFHTARMLLSYLRLRSDKRERLLYTLRICGILPVLHFFLRKLFTIA
jgi:GalNAc5-diNAcBac-PP-undecaprenol beta-1,3-glucosyltransferase